MWLMRSRKEWKHVVGRSELMYCMSWRRRSVGHELLESDNEFVTPSVLASAVQFGEGTDVRLSTQTCGI